MGMVTLRTDPGEDIIDVRDLISRFEDLETLLEAMHDEGEESPDDEILNEYHLIKELLENLRGMSEDEHWRGFWYPVTLLLDSYMETYAREFAEDIGAIGKDAAWPACHIDWEAATDSFKMDYSTVEYGGYTYYYR